ncbi:MAG: AsmA family protein, partial [Terriglobus roseus]|nr:AsmA family protein [Terriglobus roseus]
MRVSSDEVRITESQPGGGKRTLKRKLLWALGLLLAVLLLVFTPPLVNANRYRGKIAESMSKSLGRPVHLDNVSLHFLPVPGFTLTNVVVSEDPAFGDEPTIRANTVEAQLRVSSLWKHPVEFSTVRFVEPSVNLVRNAEGKWNLSNVLLNASHVQSAPTGQRRAGPKPRFPYIEATGGRVNIKIGREKLPFSLTDADFALWLPSPQQWRVRLIGQPARTDKNINDPGRLRIEGELRHAATAADVPVHFTASWHDAPLGEATRILAGDDWGWRGSLNLDATLAGTLGDAQMQSKLTLGGLRRAEFYPAHTLDLQATCTSGFKLHPATLSQMRCTLPDDAPSPM